MFSSVYSSKVRSMVTLAFALIGVLALIIFLFGLITGQSRESSQEKGFFAALSAAFSRRQEAIVVRAEPAEIPSGGTFHLSWLHETKRRGSYELMLSCPDGVMVHQANRPEEALCSKTISINPDQFLLLTSANQKSEPLTLRANVFFEADSENTSELLGAFVLITIKPASKSEPPKQESSRTSPAATRQLPPSSPPTQPISVAVTPELPDLAVRIIDIGTTTQDAKQFFPAASIKKTDLAAVLFEVSNLGRVPTPQWSFEAWLPIESSSFNSSLQPSIPVGGSVRFILGFSGLHVYPAGAEYKVTIRVDPKNEIKELNEDNNSAIKVLSVVN